MSRVLVAFLLIITISACHSSKNSERWEDPIYARSSSHGGRQQGSTSANQQSRRNQHVSGDAGAVIDAACAWIGVPYKYGGNTRAGVDCSGLVCMAFEKGAGIRLPRSSADQANWCAKISRGSLKPGDLVFFTNKRGGAGRINHVALFIGDGRMVHSTTSRGVIISSLDEDYWRTHFHSCGRVFK